MEIIYVAFPIFLIASCAFVLVAGVWCWVKFFRLRESAAAGLATTGFWLILAAAVSLAAFLRN